MAISEAVHGLRSWSRDAGCHNDGRVWIRAERDGRGAVRVYPILPEAVDAGGNTSIAEVAIAVGHDRRLRP